MKKEVKDFRDFLKFLASVSDGVEFIGDDDCDCEFCRGKREEVAAFFDRNKDKTPLQAFLEDLNRTLDKKIKEREGNPFKIVKRTFGDGKELFQVVKKGNDIDTPFETVEQAREHVKKLSGDLIIKEEIVE